MRTAKRLKVRVGATITFKDHLAQKDRTGLVTGVDLNAHGLLTATAGRSFYYVEKEDVIEVLK